ncbi:hypothetical protein BDQ17DRAFT_1502221 [Cyathus striatus]|nr:hypothetical protein BDQ17DRAFT_1502221 [Cyathus striatus]
MDFTSISTEMLETPKIAEVLHSVSFQDHLSAVYLDEAHSVYESASWFLGPEIPLVALSATFPQRYCDVLVIYAGLHPDYYLINLGNFRPELSTIVKRMQHSASSFLDLGFVTKLAEQQTMIIYCDDLQMLTDMFWWIYKQLACANLPVTWLDILHAGLSDIHQRQCITGVSEGCIKILLGSEKIGSGMDFPLVGLIVQYQCHGLSIVQWEQRRDQGARSKGTSAVGVILVEKSMNGEASDSPTVKNPKSQDIAFLDLIQTNQCLQRCTDKWLENPPCTDDNPCHSCTNCNPQLVQLTDHYTFVPESTPKLSQHRISDSNVQKIYDALSQW